MFSDPFVLALRLARTFDTLGIPYLIGGSVATSIHGELRTTQDIDFVAHLRDPGPALWEPPATTRLRQRMNRFCAGATASAGNNQGNWTGSAGKTSGLRV